MSIQNGEKIDAKEILRSGFCYNPDSNSATPIRFSYDVRDPEAPNEPWGQGASLFLNPNARFPLPPGYSKRFKLAGITVEMSFRIHLSRFIRLFLGR